MGAATAPLPPKKTHGRPRLKPGEHGDLRVRAVVGRREIPEGEPVPKGARWRAVANVRLPNGELTRLERSGKSKTAASNAWHAAYRELMPRGTTRLTSRSRYSDLAPLYVDWLNKRVENKELAPTSRDRYVRVLETHVLPAFRHLELHEIDLGRCEDLMDRLKPTQGASSRRQVRVVIRDSLWIAINRHKAITTNPALQMARIVGSTRKRPRALTAIERDDMIAKLRDDTYARRSSIADLVLFMLGTGCRIAEALALKWSDVDLVGVRVRAAAPGEVDRLVPVVRLGPIVAEVKGEGLVWRGKGKTGKDDEDRRLVPLPPFAVDMLALRRPEWATDDDPVFWSRVRTHRQPRNVHRTWRSTRARHDLEWVTPHVFRKTAISEWKAMGLSDLQIADLAGHANVSMTQDVYFGRGTLHPEAAGRSLGGTEAS